MARAWLAYYGAITNNNAGVAGMTWSPYILPVRALGKCGGYDSDIMAAIEWAAGLDRDWRPGQPVPRRHHQFEFGGGTGSCPFGLSE